MGVCFRDEASDVVNDFFKDSSCAFFDVFFEVFLTAIFFDGKELPESSVTDSLFSLADSFTDPSCPLEAARERVADG